MVRSALWFVLSPSWVFVCFVFQNPLSSGEVGSEASVPGARLGQPAGSQVAAGSSGSGPIPQAPQDCFALQRKRIKDKEHEAKWPHGADSTGERRWGCLGRDPSDGRKDLGHRLVRDQACTPCALGWPDTPPSVAEGPTPSPGSG